MGGERGGGEGVSDPASSTCLRSLLIAAPVSLCGCAKWHFSFVAATGLLMLAVLSSKFRFSSVFLVSSESSSSTIDTGFFKVAGKQM